MRFVGLLVILVSLTILSNSISAHFFPNISSIPSLLNKTKCAWDEFQKLTGCRPGDTIDGLSNLKNYLKQFGYIVPDSALNFTEFFDNTLESAIKIYQKNFNLNVTGILDGPTLRQIQQPRCGMPDIINGSTSMNSGHQKAVHFHTVSHYSFFPGQPRWPDNQRDLTYAFSPGTQISDDVRTLFARAFSRWAAVTPLTFTAINSYFTADIRIGFFAGDHGDGEPFDGVLGTLAHAFSPPSGLLHLDGDENWVVSGDIRRASLDSAIDMESVVVHEIGHLLGLGHSSVEESIMFPTITARTRKVDLANDDINGVQVLYGGNPNGNNVNNNSTTLPPPSGRERDTSPNGAHALRLSWAPLFLIAVGFFFIFF